MAILLIGLAYSAPLWVAGIKPAPIEQAEQKRVFIASDGSRQERQVGAAALVIPDEARLFAGRATIDYTISTMRQSGSATGLFRLDFYQNQARIAAQETEIDTVPSFSLSQVLEGQEAAFDPTASSQFSYQATLVPTSSQPGTWQVNVDIMWLNITWQKTDSDHDGFAQDEQLMSGVPSYGFLIFSVALMVALWQYSRRQLRE